MAGEAVTVGKSYKNTTGMKLYFTYRWHPNCWVEQGLVELEKHPYVPAKVGRKKLELDKDTRAKRIGIMRRRAATIQRIKMIKARPIEEWNLDAIVHLGDMLAKLADEIEPYGGTPKGWR